MDSKKYVLLTAGVLLIVMPAHADKPVNRPSEYVVTILEQSSRMSQFTKTLAPSSNLLTSEKVNVGQILPDASVAITKRPVVINGHTGYVWIETKLIDKKNNVVASATGTFREGAFSLGATFKSSTGPEGLYIFMVDTTATDPALNQSK